MNAARWPITLTLAGTTSTECTQEALQLLGKKPLHEVARDDPEDALRVSIREKRRPYNDESPVCSAGHVKLSTNWMESSLMRQPILSSQYPACLSFCLCLAAPRQRLASVLCLVGVLTGVRPDAGIP